MDLFRQLVLGGMRLSMAIGVGGSSGLSLESHSVPLEDLRKITNNFSDERLLGQGGFGKVYKGVLENGGTIAVKKLTETMPGTLDGQFENEVNHLMRLRHPNVVQLLGYCSETETIRVCYKGKYVYAEKSEMLLCLEYLPEGNLCRHLSDESSGLDWKTRYKIIQGICNGLYYLHEGQAGAIIHMDMKPANILLDISMTPKIANFGISRLFGEEKTRTCTRNRDGTLGYMAPEYMDRGIITKKYIFSLGVIIIEIITGRKDYPDETRTSSAEYVELVLKNWRQRGYPSRPIDYFRIATCIYFGLLCVQRDPEKRPTIRQIMEILHGSIPEELRQRVLANFRNLDPRERIAQNMHPTYKLCFLNTLNSEIYTQNEIRAADGGHIKIGMVASNQQAINSPLLSATVEIVVLDGIFNMDNHDGWTSEDFKNHILHPRHGVGWLLGNVVLKLYNGVTYLNNNFFLEDSRLTISGKFRLGVMLREDSNERVQEAITEPIIVKEGRYINVTASKNLRNMWRRPYRIGLRYLVD